MMDDYGTLKLSDFGFAVKYKDGMVLTELCGTPGLYNIYTYIYIYIYIYNTYAKHTYVHVRCIHIQFIRVKYRQIHTHIQKKYILIHIYIYI